MYGTPPAPGRTGSPGDPEPDTGHARPSSPDSARRRARDYPAAGERRLTHRPRTADTPRRRTGASAPPSAARAAPIRRSWASRPRKPVPLARAVPADQHRHPYAAGDALRGVPGQAGVAERVRATRSSEQVGPDGGLWLDYVADLGDGFDATYSVAYLLAQPELTVDGHRLPRAQTLVMGGDQVYPSASYEAYEDRCKGPVPGGAAGAAAGRASRRSSRCPATTTGTTG